MATYDLWQGAVHKLRNATRGRGGGHIWVTKIVSNLVLLALQSEVADLGKIIGS